MLFDRLHKCEFLGNKVGYLGFEISANGIHGSSDKVKKFLTRQNHKPYAIFVNFGNWIHILKIYYGVLKIG